MSHPRLLRCFACLALASPLGLSANPSTEKQPINAASPDYGAVINYKASAKAFKNRSAMISELVDNNFGTRFVVTGAPYTLEIVLPAPVNVTKLALSLSTKPNESAPKEIDVFIDGAAPLRHTLEKRHPANGVSGWQEIPVGRSVQNVKVKVVSLYEGAANYGGFSEIALLTEDALELKAAPAAPVASTATTSADSAAAASGPLDPKSFRQGLMKNPRVNNTDGELFCWNAQIGAHDIITGYEATGDVRWLEEASVYFDFLISKLKKDPDGYEGWIGKTIWSDGRADHEKYRANSKVGDAILLQPMLQFAEIVLVRQPDLKERFGAKAQAYVDLATRIGWESWNRRGVYYRDAAGFGSYHINARFIDAETWKWVPAPMNPHSENLNKHSAMAIVMLRLWRITGKEEYRVRAEEIFARLKNLFRYFPEEDRVVWNFWMPHAPYDILNGKVDGWIAVHPKRGSYQADEVARMVEAYDSGIVFDQADLERIIRTNHYMLASQSNGKYRGADGVAEAGALWASLARFDEKIRDAVTRKYANPTSAKERIARTYHENVTAKNLGWTRRYVKNPEQIRVFNHAPQPGRALSATVVIPDKILTSANERACLVTQTRAAGPLKIELLDATGQQVLGEIFSGQGSPPDRVLLPYWDGTNPKTKRKDPGAYLIRWTLNSEVRTERVWVADR